MTKEEWFDLPKLKMFDKDFNEKQFDEEMALGLLNELQVNWCGRHCDNYIKNSCGCYFPKFKEQMILKIKDRFESKENTLEFKNFRLHADSTLKCMSKDELISYIHMLHYNWSVSDEQLFNVIKINNKLQDELDAIKNPQPYKFEDLKELIGKPIFDYKYKEFYILAEVKEEELYKDEGLEKFMICSDKKGLMRVYFEEGRFFPVTKVRGYCEVNERY